MRKAVVFYLPFIVFMMVVLGCKDSFRTSIDEQSVSIGSPDGMFQAQATKLVSENVVSGKSIYELLVWKMLRSKL